MGEPKKQNAKVRVAKTFSYSLSTNVCCALFSLCHFRWMHFSLCNIHMNVEYRNDLPTNCACISISFYRKRRDKLYLKMKRQQRTENDNITKRMNVWLISCPRLIALCTCFLCRHSRNTASAAAAATLAATAVVSVDLGYL